jgi:hypothetical protein
MTETSSNKPAAKRLSSAIYLGGLCFLMACVFQAIQVHSTSEFFALGLIFSVMSSITYGIMILLATIIVERLIFFLNHTQRLPAWVNRKFLILMSVGMSLGMLSWTAYAFQPRNRLKTATSGAMRHASNVRVLGFNGFLASRWLYRFDANEQDVKAIAAALQLEPSEKVPFRQMMKDDVFMSPFADSMVADLEEQTVSFLIVNKKPDSQSSRWTRLVFCPKTQRAWLYRGFQN